MRFRYLIGVPFQSHGSEVAAYDGHESPDGLVSGAVVPAAAVGALDFKLLERAFARVPAFVGLPAASFSFEPKNNLIRYEGIPTPRTCWTRLISDQQLHTAWMAERQAAVATLRKMLVELDCALRTEERSGIAATMRSVLAHVADSSASLFFTSLFDEHAFDEVEFILRKIPGMSTRTTLYHRILTSPHSLAYMTVPPELLMLKRLRVPNRTTFPPPAVAPEDSAVLREICRLSSHLDENELRALQCVRAVYDASEEFSVLWVSVMSLLSAGLTRLFPEDLIHAAQRDESTIGFYPYEE